jgi:hypothetical protein
MKTKSLSDSTEYAVEHSNKGIVEKRQHRRYPTALKGEVVIHSRVTCIEVLDMSKSGARLRILEKGHKLPGIGEIIDLSLVWPMSKDNEPLHVESIVVRSNEHEFAVAFGHTRKRSQFH